jgi:hypothetical protein
MDSMSRIWHLAVAFFSTRGAWYGYVFHLGVIWLGGITSIHWYFLEYDGRPLTAVDIFQIALWRVGVGTPAALVFYGIMRPAEAFRRGRSISEFAAKRRKE